MEERTLSEQESLSLIRQMIDTARGRISENGHLYLLWGWAVFICSVGQYILMNYVKTDKHYRVWIVMWLIFIYQMIYLRRKKKTMKVKAYTDDVIAAIWIVFVMLMFMFAVVIGGFAGPEYYKMVNPGFLALYGMPTILSGAVLRFRPLIYGGIVCWLLCVASTQISYEYHLLLLAAAVVAAWIVPGYLLRKQSQNSLAYGT